MNHYNLHQMKRRDWILAITLAVFAAPVAVALMWLTLAFAATIP